MLAVVQLLSHVQLFVTPWTAAHQASLSFTIFWSLLKLTSIGSVMLSNHFILCRPLLLLPSVFPIIWERLKGGGEGTIEDETVGWHHRLNGLKF